jgi:nitrogen regulatory protein P-II 2
MNTTKLRKVTIIAEAVLEDRLLREVRELGSRGYTMTAVSGEGSRGVRASEFEGKNVQIEVLVSAVVADRLLDHLAANYFEHYAVVAYVVEVEVVRWERYI